MIIQSHRNKVSTLTPFRTAAELPSLNRYTTLKNLAGGAAVAFGASACTVMGISRPKKSVGGYIRHYIERRHKKLK